MSAFGAPPNYCKSAAEAVTAAAAAAVRGGATSPHPTNNSFIVIDAILEVSETATTVQIRNAYKRFVTLPANSA